MKTLTVIDTFAFFFRSYFALPPLKSADGFPTGLLTGFINFIHKLQNEHSTDYILFALDSEGKTFRSKIYPEYKANRPSPPSELIEQLPIAIEWINKMGFANISVDGFEADDVIASVVKHTEVKDIECKIVSSDKDLYQLLDDSKVYLYDWVKKRVVDESECEAKFGVLPKYFVDFQALIGDSSDNVPGVPGIGPKTASKLINEYHTLENLYANIQKAGTPRIRKLLIEYKEQAFISRDLVKLRDNLFDKFDLEKFRFEDKNYLEALKDEFIKYGMRQAIEWSIDKSIASNTSKDGIEFETILIDSKEQLFETLCCIPPNTVITFDTETTGLDRFNDKIVGFSFAWESNKAYYVPIAHSYLGVGTQVSKDDAIEALKLLFHHRIVGQNIKFDLMMIYNNFGLNHIEPWADTMVMAWLLQPGSRVGLDNLAQKYLNHTMISYKDTVKKGEDFSFVDLKEASRYASEDAIITLLLYKKFDNMIKNSWRELDYIAKHIEYPFINVLIAMELTGIKVDINRLLTLKTKVEERLNILTESIYELSKTKFNIKSTKQLGEVLFGTLKLEGGKKTKTGYSTNEKVLAKLIDKHPVIPLILEYRENQKILSTYIKPLLLLAKKDKNSRVHTTFLQTGTATGRLSSKDPNLQNIPVRSPLGKEVRDAFVAPDGYKLVSIDYSQIELRLLAHFSQDRVLIEAFKDGIDIHMATAVKLFGEAKAQEKRSFAKSINFGLLYGMGPRKLSDELGITNAKAKEIITAYFKAFPTVKEYLYSIEEFVKSNGYVQTLIGRRRFFDYEGATGMQKSSILREAVNTVFQGSAADLIKLAMLSIHKTIEDESLDAKMILQIHDELLFEVPIDKASEYASRFQHIMESIYKLNVPLTCSVSIGDSWSELK